MRTFGFNGPVCTFPCTTACSPYTMTFPGAETMNGAIMGVEYFRCMGSVGLGLSGRTSDGIVGAVGENRVRESGGVEG
jgi:hypothetical protein